MEAFQEEEYKEAIQDYGSLQIDNAATSSGQCGKTLFLKVVETSSSEVVSQKLEIDKGGVDLA